MRPRSFAKLSTRFAPTPQVIHATALPDAFLNPLRTSCEGVEALPDFHALFRRQVQLVAGLHVERRVPRLEIAQHAVGARFTVRVRIGCQPDLEVFITIKTAP